MLFKWKNDYSCGIPEIDRQHKVLMEIGNRIYDQSTLKDRHDHYDEIMAILQELTDYTVFHFDYEEKHMQLGKYENYDEHKLEHDFFIKKIKRIERKDIDNMQVEALMELLEFVADWILTHIIKMDVQMSGSLKDKINFETGVKL